MTTLHDIASQLIDDGIRDYATLIKNKDMLLRFLNTAIESGVFDFLSENNIDDLLEKEFVDHCLFCEDAKCKFTHQQFNPGVEYGIRPQGEI